MTVLFWKKNAEIDTFARRLADDFFSQLPSSDSLSWLAQSSEPAGNRTTAKRHEVEAVLRKTSARIQQFQKEHSLGVYGKARLYMTFSERLRTLGYAHNLTEKINHVLMVSTP